MTDSGSQTSASNQPDVTGDISHAQNTAIDTEAEPSQMASTSAPVLSCANCGRPESGPEKLLKPCTMCKSVSYCSRECKKAHYKQHKNVCAVSAQEHAKAAQPKPASRAPPKKDGHRGGLQKWQFDT